MKAHQGLAAIAMLGGLAACSQAPDDGEPSAGDGVRVASEADAQVPGEAATNLDRLSAPTRTRTLVDPGHDAMGWVAADWLQLSIPLDEWTRDLLQREAGIDEFNREDALARKRQQIEAERATGRDVGWLKLTLQGELSEYDHDYGEFYISTFSPGQLVSFQPFRNLSQNPFPGGVSIRFENGADASVWKVTAERAKVVAEGLDWGRNVRLETTLDIVDVTPSADGAVILARVTEVRIADRDGRRLGELSPASLSSSALIANNQTGDEA